jgi:hypothetical protein
MRIPFIITVAITLATIGCGKEIGDACIVSSDCSQNGDRLCDTGSKDGYCTVAGCDYSTCPSEAVCVRFFTGSFANRPCDPATEDRMTSPTTNDCSLDEICALSPTDSTAPGHCVPRSSEVRFCMRKCDQASDCRGGYECRTFADMRDHGGEPVLAPGSVVDESTAPKFCAIAPLTPTP